MKNNHVELFGTLTRDIEVSRNGKGNTFVKFTLACLRDGKKTWTDYINCIAFGDMANDYRFLHQAAAHDPILQVPDCHCL